LVNNAGTLVGRRRLDEVTADYWQTVFDVNLSSALWVTQAVSPGMKRRSSGVIVNLSSVAARNGGSLGIMPYAAMKAALLCMTKSLARELIRDGIRGNAVSPGVIPTPLHDKFTPPDLMEKLVAVIPQGRAGTADEVAAVVAFLAGLEASHIVGETIEVNGGLLMD
jgi:3-oxoacyl-[acyl-carrier protein] reductase